MVGPLKLTQFYGHSLPRPRIYADVKFNDHRVDPPPSVNDALLSWANDAPWSMGGLAPHRRVRAQGKLEGSARKLRSMMEEVEEEEEKMKKPERPVRSSPSDTNIDLPAKREEVHVNDDEGDKDNESAEVLATPARKIKKRNRSDNGDAGSGTPSSASAVQETPFSAEKAVEVGSSDLVLQRRRGKTILAEAGCSPSGRQTRSGNNKSPSPLMKKADECDEGRLTRSAKKLRRSGDARDSEAESVGRSTSVKKTSNKDEAAEEEADRSHGKGPVRRLLSDSVERGEEDRVSNSEDGGDGDGGGDDESLKNGRNKKGSPGIRRSSRKEGRLSLG